MVDVKQAVKAAIAFVADLYPQGKDIRLEEVETYGPNWNVVVSFLIDNQSPNALAMVMGATQNRLYKAVIIDDDTGEAKSLKVWKQ